MWGLMALLLLNCSVDTTVLFAESLQPVHTFSNDQESIIEIVLEQFLGLENAIPECNGKDIDQQKSLKKAQLLDVFIMPDVSWDNFDKANVNSCLFFSRSEDLISHHFKIPSPPPEV
jgi:hypothetical protein